MVPALHQDQERRLKRILGFVPVAQDTLADAENHCAVTPEDGLKRHFLPVDEILREELSVGNLASIRASSGPHAQLPDKIGR